MDFRQVGSITGNGSGPGQFATALRGITIDAAHRVLAVGDSAVHVFSREGEFLLTWRTSIPGYCVAVASDGRVYVGEAGQVEIFDPAGKQLGVWHDAEHLGLITAIGFVQAHVLAADARARCIRRLDVNGTYQGDIGNDNKMKGFQIPNGILDFSVDRAGVIHAANPARHRIERYNTNGELLGHFGRFDGRSPAGFAGCCNPTNVTVSTAGWTFVTEKANARAKVYDSQGKLLGVIADTAFDPACKNMDIAVDSRGRVYVVDTVKLKILAFDPIAVRGETPSTDTSMQEAGAP